MSPDHDYDAPCAACSHPNGEHVERRGACRCGGCSGFVAAAAPAPADDPTDAGAGAGAGAGVEEAPLLDDVAPDPLDDLTAAAAEQLAEPDPPLQPPPHPSRFTAGNTVGAGPSRRYDWPAVKKHYVEGVKHPDRHEWPTLDETARHFDIHPPRVRERSAAEGWRGERQQWMSQVEATRRQARAAALAKTGLDLDNKALDSSKLGLQLCYAELTMTAQAVQEARSSGRPVRLDALQQTRLAQAVDLWHRIGQRAIGDPEVYRLEVTGANGAPIEIAQELRRDDPERMAGVLGVLRAAGLGELFGDDADVAQRTLEAHAGADGVYTTQ